MDVQVNAGWADRLGSTARVLLIIAAALLTIMMLGMVAGYGVAIYEDGKLPTKPLAYIVFAAIVGVTALAGWLLATLIRSLRPQTMSRFDRRYWKMWAAIVALGIPLGIILAIVGLGDQREGVSIVISNAPIGPLAAIAASTLLVVLCALSAIYYHRTVDDHEERAYLWGSTIAYYFLVLAFPLHWLLARASLVPQITIGVALLIVLISCILQAIVWGLFKFR